MWAEIVILLIIFSIWFYRWGTKNHDFFTKRKMPYEKPVFFIGGGLDILLRKKSMFDFFLEMHKKYEGKIIYGAFDNRVPTFMIRDPQLIKQILIKDFDHFVNRRQIFDSSENFFVNSLFLMTDQKWRDMRSTLSPAFTGSKMRQMFLLILQTLDNGMGYLKEQQENVANKEQGFELDVKEFTIRLMTDSIASTAFGLQVDSFKDRENEFYMRSKKAVTFTGWEQTKAMLIVVLPKVAEFLKIDIFAKEFTDYFMRLVLDTMKYRQKHNVHRPDMIELLMEAKGMIPSDAGKNHNREWSDIEIVSQCFIFFFAALEPLSGAMSFAAHELMEYPEVQEKLYQEILEFDEQLDDKSVSYEILQKMPYLDMVVSEVLRKWPIPINVDRTCTKDFLYKSPETGEEIVIKKDEMIRVCMAAIQRDAAYFENPDILDPERFNEANKKNIDNGTYLPFGLGPRNCIGNRIALLEMKAFLYNVIRDYRLEPSPQSCLPMELCTKNVSLRPKNGFWIQFKPRK